MKEAKKEALLKTKGFVAAENDFLIEIKYADDVLKQKKSQIPEVVC